jgi:hypothetical protein
MRGASVEDLSDDLRRRVYWKYDILRQGAKRRCCRPSRSFLLLASLVAVAFSSQIGRRQTEKGIEGNLAGEGIVQGGIIVLNGAGGVEYMYKEKTGYQIPRDEIVEVLDRMVG